MSTPSSPGAAPISRAKLQRPLAILVYLVSLFVVAAVLIVMGLNRIFFLSDTEDFAAFERVHEDLATAVSNALFFVVWVQLILAFLLTVFNFVFFYGRRAGMFLKKDISKDLPFDFTTAEWVVNIVLVGIALLFCGGATWQLFHGQNENDSTKLAAPIHFLLPWIVVLVLGAWYCIIPHIRQLSPKK